jgi:hypothetical protein
VLETASNSDAISHHSRRIALGAPDGRTREGKLIQKFRAELTAHAGGRPSAVQAALIEQACQLRLRIPRMDQRFAATGLMSEHASRTYLALSNSLARLLKQLGLRGAPPRVMTLAEHLAARHAAQEAASTAPSAAPATPQQRRHP